MTMTDGARKPAVVLVLAVLVLAGAASPADALSCMDRARSAKAQADVRALVDALERHQAHTGALPESLEMLTSPATNRRGEIATPFLREIPAPPAGWTPYVYTPEPQGTFTITTGSAQDGIRLRHGPEGLQSMRDGGLATAAGVAAPAALIAIIGGALIGPWIFAAMKPARRRRLLQQAAGFHLGLGVILIVAWPMSCASEATRLLREIVGGGSVLLVLAGILDIVYVIASWLRRAPAA